MKKIYVYKFAVRTIFAKIIQLSRCIKYRLLGLDVDYSVVFERNINIDRLYPRGIHIGKNSLIASNVCILTHDHCKRVDGQPLLADVYIGNKCFVAVGAIILPGIKIGDEVIIGAGSVVTKDVPSNCIVAGNPARIIKSRIEMNEIAAMTNWKQ